MDKRTIARELAMQALYQLDVQGDDCLPTLRMFFRELSEDDIVIKLAEDWTKGTWQNITACEVGSGRCT